MDLEAEDVVMKHLDIDKQFNCEKIYDVQMRKKNETQYECIVGCKKKG